MMKAHPVDPTTLADDLSQQDDEPTDAWLRDIVEHPDLYYVDYVGACEKRGVLPLSATAWRRACLTV